MDKLLAGAGVKGVPRAEAAIFVGTEFDSLTGRGGDDGTPLRKTPWGEIAYQLNGEEGFALVAEHEKQLVSPAGDVIRRMLPQDRPCLILIDELMNYISRSRKSGLSAQLYVFLQNLSEVARGEDRVVLVVSVPASELEMTAEDQSDYERLKKLLDRVGKAVIMSAENETSEIIRRRLFEWDPYAVSQNGTVILNRDAMYTCSEYGDWMVDHRQQLPGWFPADTARETFAATYPFHPALLSVFERKWQALPRFQQTRGILRLLALWVSKAYRDGYKGAHRDPLIGLGSAPLDDPLFRAAAFEQLGESRLEGVVTTDICGKKDSFAIRLDKEAVDTVKKVRLHQKIATSIFFESNGGQLRTEATVPEIRLAVGEPVLDMGNVEMALEALESSCYFLSTERNRYRFSLTPNLNKLLADRRAGIKPDSIELRVKEEIQNVFDNKGNALKPLFFPEKSGQIPDRPALTLLVLAPQHSMQDQNTVRIIETMIKEHGQSARTYKSALIWAVADADTTLKEEARKLLAWEDIKRDKQILNMDDVQKKQLEESLKKAERDLRECVWRVYKHIALIGKDNRVRLVDLGLVHSSAASTIVDLMINRLRQDGDIEESISPNFLVRNWPPAFKEWSTRAVRDVFFASPQFPRLLDAESLKGTISRSVANGVLAYVGMDEDGRYKPFYYEQELDPREIEFADDMFIITGEEAKKHLEPPKLTKLSVTPQSVNLQPGKKQAYTFKGYDQHGNDIQVKETFWKASGGIVDQEGIYQAGNDEGSFVLTVQAENNITATANINISSPSVEPPSQPRGPWKISWGGDIPTQKWMNFYTKVLAKYAGVNGLRIRVNFDVTLKEEISPQKIEELKAALRELGLNDTLNISE